MRLLIVALVFAGTPAPSFAQQAAAEVRATCVDARGVPHPAAQTFGQREVAPGFEGEVFRCLAGTHMRYEINAAVSVCGDGEALWFAAGALSCRTAAAHPREHDRDLLRQFGPGVKLAVLASETAPASRRGPPPNPYPYRRN